MLEHMLEHGLPDITPHCLNVIRNVFEADIESIPEEPELPDVPPEKAEKIASLIRIIDAQYGVTGSKNRLNHCLIASLAFQLELFIGGIAEKRIPA